MATVTRKRVAPAETYNEPDVDETEVTEEENDSVESPKNIVTGWAKRQAPKTFRKTVQAPYLDLRDGRKHLIKILNDEPAATWNQHYINSVGKGFYCMQETELTYNEAGKPVLTVTQNCPLCDAGHYAGVRYMLNVVDLSVDAEVVLKWEFGREVETELQIFMEDTNGPGGDPMFYPFEREDVYFHAYQVDKTGRKAKFTKIDGLKAKYLDDWNAVPLNEEELADLMDKRYGKEIVWINSETQLREAALALTDKDTAKPDWGKKDK